MSEWKYKANDRVDRGRSINSDFHVAAGTIVGRFTNKRGVRYYEIKFDGSLAARCDGSFNAEEVEKHWRKL